MRIRYAHPRGASIIATRARLCLSRSGQTTSLAYAVARIRTIVTSVISPFLLCRNHLSPSGSYMWFVVSSASYKFLLSQRSSLLFWKPSPLSLFSNADMHSVANLTFCFNDSMTQAWTIFNSEKNLLFATNNSLRDTISGVNLHLVEFIRINSDSPKFWIDKVTLSLKL